MIVIKILASIGMLSFVGLVISGLVYDPNGKWVEIFGTITMVCILLGVLIALWA